MAERRDNRIALRFIILIGILSFFADFTYEGSRSIVGPYLATLQATGTIVGIVTGFGELLGYGLRLFSGRWADATGRYWPITIFGYAMQMAAVPALALTGSWPAAAALIILERVGKAIRNPPRDVMLSHAGKQAGGYGWAFGLHEALDQFGATSGPLVVSAVLAHDGSYHEAFAVLLVPAVINLSLVLLARFLYPKPQDLDHSPPATVGANLPRIFWIYLLGAILVAAGFADYPLIAFHFTRNGTIPSDWIAIFYAVAMAVSGTGSLVFGRLFDRYGFIVLVILTLLSALFAPLVFLGGFWLALVGAAVWGLGMGVHKSSFPRLFHQWWQAAAEPRRSARLLPAMVSSGLSAARPSVSCMTLPLPRSSLFVLLPSLRRCLYFFSWGVGLSFNSQSSTIRECNERDRSRPAARVPFVEGL
jgi:predicted MFS family arabinose efflux permease